MFAKLFEYRQQSDYGKFIMTEDLVAPLVKQVEEFKKNVLDLLAEAGYKTNNES